jgi:hypothetical protein
MNGLYYNRSGIAIDFNGYSRPRSYHPDNGAVVYQATVGLFETGNGLDASGRGQGNFNQLIESRTEHTLRGDAIWGGYYDAADWDKRIQHLQATRAQLELMLMYPGKLDGIDMGLPDSALVYNNYTLEDMEKAELKQEDTEGIPDALAECLWNLDYTGDCRSLRKIGYRMAGIGSVELEAGWKPPIIRYGVKRAGRIPLYL